MPKKPVIYKPKLTIRKREFDIDRDKVAIEICEWQSKSEEYRHDWMKSYEEELKNLYNDKDDSDENFSIPLSLYHTDKKHSSIYNVIFGMNKMIIAKPTSSEDVKPVRKKEQWMNWELKIHMNQVDTELGISNQGDKFVHGVTAFGEGVGMVTWKVDRKFGKEYRIFKLPEFSPPEETELPFIEGRAGGGDIFKGQPYLVGEQGPEVVIPQENGIVIPNDEIGKIQSILQNNVNKNFVQRILNPDTSPKIQGEDGKIMTHSMSYSTDDKGGAFVYPLIIEEKPGILRKLSPQEAITYAKKTGEFIYFNNVDDAEWFGKNYKKVWGKPLWSDEILNTKDKYGGGNTKIRNFVPRDPGVGDASDMNAEEVQQYRDWIKHRLTQI